MPSAKTPKTPAPPRKRAAKTAKAAPPAAVAEAPVAAAKPPKVARPKLVRDSFTMPESDFALIDLLKARALGARRAAKKSELLRAGLQALAALDAKALAQALDRLETVKTGRPKKSR